MGDGPPRSAPPFFVSARLASHPAHRTSRPRIPTTSPNKSHDPICFPTFIAHLCTLSAFRGGCGMGSVLVALNGADVWAYVVETDDGLRVRFALDDWQRLNLGQGQRIRVRVSGK